MFHFPLIVQLGKTIHAQLCKKYFTFFRALEGVSADMRECFEERAKLLIEEKGGVECVAAALVLLSGTTQLPHRSLITCQQVTIYAIIHVSTVCE